MTSIKPVTPENHIGKYWKRYTSYDFAAKTHLAPIVVAEIPHAALAMPLCFALQNDRLVFAAVLSPVSGENLFVDPTGRWLGAYIPSCFRGYPFRLAVDQQSKAITLCIDESSGLVTDSPGEPFFDPDGALAKPAKDVLEFLKKVEGSRIGTDLAVAALSGAGAMIEWPLAVTIGSEKHQLKGIYRIDDQRLSQLDEKTFLHLRKAGALPLAYAQLLSMGNTRFFAKLAQMQAHIEKQAPQEVPDLDKIFGEDDIFKF